MVKAVIDRIVDEKQAVLLVGEEEVEKVVSIEELPFGASEGMWLILQADGAIEIDKEETDQVKLRVKNKMALLRNNGKSKFKK